MTRPTPTERQEKQERKYHLSLAGEFFVAAELQRRGIKAAVTYGNAKAADIVAFSGDGERAVVIEVKSTAQSKWVVGGLPGPGRQPWVFVHIAEDHSVPPEYYVLLQDELHEIVKRLDDEYQKRYGERHGTDVRFEGRGVVSLPLSEARQHRDKWQKIEALLNGHDAAPRRRRRDATS